METVSFDPRPLADRYRPTSLGAVIGNSSALAELRRWGDAWARVGRPPRARAAVLEGPPGVGKTTAALALAADLGWPVVEMNASDARNQSAVEQVAGRAAATQTLGTTGRFRPYKAGARTLILLDEADSLSGRISDAPTVKPTPVGFRDFVRRRYGSLDAVNKAWGLTGAAGAAAFERWEQIPATGGRAAWTRRPPVQRDLEEWRSDRKPPDYSDRGGLPTILRLIPETRQPIVLTVNDWSPYSRSGPEFRQAVVRIRFDFVARGEVEALLRRVIASERYVITREALTAILDRSRGDVRAALNDLDAIAPLPPGPAQHEVLSARDQPEDFFALTEEVLRAPRYFRGGEVRARLDATPDDLLPWIEENVPRVASSVDAVAAGIEEVGTAERFLALARRQRVWALWSFASEIMTGGAGLAMRAQSDPDLHRPLAFPQFLGLMGRSRVARATRVAVARKIGAATHVSIRKATDIGLPWLEWLMRAEGTRAASRRPTPSLVARLVEELRLSEEEVQFLMERSEWAEEARRPRPAASTPPKPTNRAMKAPDREKSGRRGSSSAAVTGGPAKDSGRSQRRIVDY